MSALRIGALLATLAALASPALAGGPLSVCAQVPTKYSGAGTVRLNYDLGNLGSRTKLQADALVSASVANWTNVSTSTVSLTRGTDLPVDVTSANYTSYIGGGTYTDGINPVVYDTDGAIIDILLGAGASSSVLGFAGSAWNAPSGQPCTYIEGRAVINGKVGVSDTTMRVVLTHEIGHLIGLDHTQLDSEQGLTPPNYPVMYPVANRSTDALHEDDIAAVSALYPDTTLNAAYGQLSGTFTLVGGVPVRGANLWAVETTTGKLYSVVSDYLEQGTGYFKLLLPPGTYTLRAGAIRSNFNGGSSVGPYSETSAGLSFLSPLYTGTTRMAPVALGGATPTTFTITAGCAATATFRFDGSGSVTGNCTPPPVTYALTVTKAGSGSGTLASGPSGILCGAVCSASFTSGANVTLSAVAGSGSVFSGWTGACTGTGGCSVTMNAARSVTATFDTTLPSDPLVTRYRLYSPGTFEHLYTTDLNEYQALPTCCGWLPEGAIYRVLRAAGSYNGVAAVPYFRLYNPFSYQHHWTTDPNEYSVLPSFGWLQEGIDGYILPSQAPGTVALYRLYLNAYGGLHLWTTDAYEVTVLTTQNGWVNEGIAGYVVPLP